METLSIKRRPGRPSGRILSERVEVLMRPDQREALLALAQQAGQSPGEFLRRLLERELAVQGSSAPD